MQIHEVGVPKGARRRRKIVGRGRGSGLGKTSGRGHKGQKARAGRGILNSLEGGQMPLIRRIPKVGFRPHRRTFYRIVTLTQLSRFPAGETVTAERLQAEGIVRDVFKPFKVLNVGELGHALTVEAYAFSKEARRRIEAAGGKTVTVDPQGLKARHAAGA